MTEASQIADEAVRDSEEFAGRRKVRLLATLAGVLLLVTAGAGGYAIRSATEGEDVAEDRAQVATSRAAQSAQERRQAEADRRAALAAIGAECATGDLPKDLQFLCDQARQLRQVPQRTDDDEVQDAEIQEPEKQQQEREEVERQQIEQQEREFQNPEFNDLERQEDELQQAETDDPEEQEAEVQEDEEQEPEEQEAEVQEDEIQEPENQEPENQEAEQQDPQDPPQTMTFRHADGTTETCTRDEGSDPRNPTYSCTSSGGITP